MPSVNCLGDRLSDINEMKKDASAQIVKYRDEIELLVNKRDDKTSDFIGLDEESVELGKAIKLLKDNGFKDIDGISG